MTFILITRTSIFYKSS